MRGTLVICLFLLFGVSAYAQKDPALPDTVKAPIRSQQRDSTSNGTFFRIGRIFITGNKITRDRIILRELSFKSGDVIYSHDLSLIFDADKRKLLNTRLFNTVDIRTVELTPLTIDVIVDLDERWYTFPNPLIELADRNFNEWWKTYDHDLRRLNYGLRLYQYNMRGRNETLRLHAQFGFVRRFEVMYRIPYIDRRQKHGLSVDYNYAETKNLAFQTKDHKFDFLRSEDILRSLSYGGVTYSYRNSFYQTHLLRLEHVSASVTDTIRALNPLYLMDRAKQDYAIISYTYNSDHRDLIAYPLKGRQFVGYVSKSGILPSDDLNKTEINLTYSHFFDLGKKWYLSNNSVLYASTPEDLSYMNFGVLGLRRQFVRGYELYVIEGPQFGINKTTLKKRIFSRQYHWEDMPIQQFQHIPIAIYLKTYADIGYVENYPIYESLDINTRLSNTLLSGVGFGVDVVGSYDMVLRFEYTLNAQGERGFFFHIKREF